MGNKLVKNSLIYSVGDIAPRLLGMITFPILTRYLSPAEYGIVNYINTVNLFLSAIGFLCLNTYYLVNYYKQESEIDQKRLLGNLSIFVIGLNIFITLILFILGPQLFSLLESNISFYPYLAIGLITNLFNVFAILPAALYRLKEHPLPLTILNVSKGILYFAITIYFVVGLGFKAEGLLFSQMIVTVLFGMIFLRITIKNAKWHISMTQIKRGLIFSLPLVPGTVSYLLSTMFDRILIDKYLDLTALGIYSSASTLALILNVVSSGAYKSFEPYILKNIRNEDFITQFIKLRNGYFWVLISIALGISIFAKDFFQIFSQSQYSSAYKYVPIIIVGVICSALSMPYGTVITACGKTKVNSVINICASILSLGLNIIFLPRFGVIAACVVSAITMIIGLLLSIYFSKVRISYFRLCFTSILVIVVTIGTIYFVNFSKLWISISFKTILYVIIVMLCSHIMGIVPQKIRIMFSSSRV